MNREEQALRATLQQTQRFADGQAPEFKQIFGAAERQASRRRKAQFAAVAATLSALAFGLLLTSEDEFTYVDMDELTATTRWSAPSDSLFPAHQFDIYRELPRLIESLPVSTESDEGALL